MTTYHYLDGQVLTLTRDFLKKIGDTYILPDDDTAHEAAKVQWKGAAETSSKN
jgi:hypothetical protein